MHMEREGEKVKSTPNKNIRDEDTKACTCKTIQLVISWILTFRGKGTLPARTLERNKDTKAGSSKEVKVHS